MVLVSKWMKTIPERFELLNKISYEQILNIVEELDDEVRTQKEYFKARLFEELAQDMEDQILVNDTKIHALKP